MCGCDRRRWPGAAPPTGARPGPCAAAESICGSAEADMGVRERREGGNEGQDEEERRKETHSTEKHVGDLRTEAWSALRFHQLARRMRACDRACACVCTYSRIRACVEANHLPPPRLASSSSRGLDPPCAWNSTKRVITRFLQIFDCSIVQMSAFQGRYLEQSVEGYANSIIAMLFAKILRERALKRQQSTLSGRSDGRTR